MDFICSDLINKAHLNLSVTSAASESQIILGEAFRSKVLWKSARNCTHIEKMVIKNGTIYFHGKNEPCIIRKINEHDELITATEFYAPSYLYSITISYAEPQYLTLGEKVIKTEVQYTNFMITEHFTKRVYFIASNSLDEGDSLYAADIGKEATEVVAEKVQIAKIALTALVVDQLTGDIILAFCNNHVTKEFTIGSFQKIPYLSEIMKSAGVSSS